MIESAFDCYQVVLLKIRVIITYIGRKKEINVSFNKYGYLSFYFQNKASITRLILFMTFIK